MLFFAPAWKMSFTIYISLDFFLKCPFKGNV